MVTDRPGIVLGIVTADCADPAGGRRGRRGRRRRVAGRSGRRDRGHHVRHDPAGPVSPPPLAPAFARHPTRWPPTCATRCCTMIGRRFYGKGHGMRRWPGSKLLRRPAGARRRCHRAAAGRWRGRRALLRLSPDHARRRRDRCGLPDLAHRRRGELSAWCELLVLLLPLLLASCGDLPWPFIGNPVASGRILAQPPTSRLAGAAAGQRATARRKPADSSPMRWRRALQEREVPPVARPGARKRLAAVSQRRAARRHRGAGVPCAEPEGRGPRATPICTECPTQDWANAGPSCSTAPLARPRRDLKPTHVDPRPRR